MITAEKVGFHYYPYCEKFQMFILWSVNLQNYEIPLGLELHCLMQRRKIMVIDGHGVEFRFGTLSMDDDIEELDQKLSDEMVINRLREYFTKINSPNGPELCKTFIPIPRFCRNTKLLLPAKNMICVSQILC